MPYVLINYLYIFYHNSVYFEPQKIKISIHTTIKFKGVKNGYIISEKEKKRGGGERKTAHVYNPVEGVC